jgi:hypothetical protein
VILRQRVLAPTVAVVLVVIFLLFHTRYAEGGVRAFGAALQISGILGGAWEIAKLNQALHPDRLTFATKVGKWAAALRAKISNIFRRRRPSSAAGEATLGTLSIQGSAYVKDARLKRLPPIDDPEFHTELQAQLDSLQDYVDAVQAEGWRSSESLRSSIAVAEANSAAGQQASAAKSRELLTHVVTSSSNLRWYELSFLVVGTVLVTYAGPVSRLVHWP